MHSTMHQPAKPHNKSIAYQHFHQHNALDPAFFLNDGDIRGLVSGTKDLGVMEYHMQGCLGKRTCLHKHGGWKGFVCQIQR